MSPLLPHAPYVAGARGPRHPVLIAFAAASVGAGLARAILTTYLPVVLERATDAPALVGVVMLVNVLTGFTVPLLIGPLNDARRERGVPAGRRYILSGALVGAAGALAIAAETEAAIIVLAASALVAYGGLNLLTTIHRTFVAEGFEEGERARVTANQEVATLVGALLGTVAGGALFELATWAPFALAAAVLPVLALPTARDVGRREGSLVAPPPNRHGPRALLALARRRGIRAILVAEVLWVTGYAALPVFFILYAEEELGVGPAVAGLWLGAFGVTTGVAMLVAGRVTNGRLRLLLLAAGLAVMGAGLFAVAAASSVAGAAPGLLAAAVGFGAVSTLGFAVFASLLPAGQEGAGTALFLATRSIAGAVALPAAGWAIEASGSYRALFVLGGAMTLAALIPLTALNVGMTTLRILSRQGMRLAVFSAVALVGGLLAAAPVVRELDVTGLRLLNSLAPVPDVVWETLNPHDRNYAIIVLLLVGALAAAGSARRIPAALAAMAAAFGLAVVVLNGIYLVWDRPRPEEVMPARQLELDGNSWAHLASFPSGHAAVTAALVAVAIAMVPWLRLALAAYLIAICLSRVVFGAHFPSDVVWGAALGLLCASIALALVRPLDPARRPAGASFEEIRPVDVVAIIPSHREPPARDLLERVAARVGRVLLVNDGMPAPAADELQVRAKELGMGTLRLPRRMGKGHALAAGLDHLSRDPIPPRVVVTLDADGQHPPAAIPQLIAAARMAEMVIGDRFAQPPSMPWDRLIANRIASGLLSLVVAQPVRDSQCGMRLLRGRAMFSVPFAPGGFEAETDHLRRCLTGDVAVAWVPIPAIYDGSPSAFRALRDSGRVVWAILRPGRSRGFRSTAVGAPTVPGAFRARPDPGAIRAGSGPDNPPAHTETGDPR